MSHHEHNRRRKGSVVRCGVVQCCVCVLLYCCVLCDVVCVSACCCVRVLSKLIMCIMDGFEKQPVHTVSYHSKLRKNRLLRDCVSIRKPRVWNRSLPGNPCLVLSLILVTQSSSVDPFTRYDVTREVQKRHTTASTNQQTKKKQFNSKARVNHTKYSISMTRSG